MPKQSFWWAGCAAFYALFVAWLGTSESLWVDELHSSWAISGSWSEIATRARWGNQSPLYFWCLRLTESGLNGTVSHELAVRLPSVVCWGAAAGLLVYHVVQRQAAAAARSPWGTIGLVGLVGLVTAWLSLDRIQLFYATEARVYACLQLISFVNWLLLARLVSGRAGEDAASFQLAFSMRPATADRGTKYWGTEYWGLLAWSGLSLLLIYLHVTAALAVAWQWLFGIAAVMVLKRADRWRQVGRWLGAGAGVALLSLPAWWWSQSVWERREQWRGFAGDASLTNALALFPLMEFLVPLAVAVVLDRCWRVRVPRTLATDRQNGNKNCPGNIWLAMWLVALVGPWFCAWLATWLEVAPLMHRRFVIASALPLVALAIEVWQTLRQPVLKLLSGAGVIAWLVIGQGTVDAWQQGHLIGWQRVEGWREAVVWVNQRIEPEDEVWCASGLIEGSGTAFPLSDETNRYLSFPLRGGYAVRPATAGQRREPLALVNEPQRWKTQWPARIQLSDADLPVGRVWIVFRGTAQQLARSLKQAGIRDDQIEIAPKAFGRVAVVVVKASK